MFHFVGSAGRLMNYTEFRYSLNSTRATGSGSFSKMAPCVYFYPTQESIFFFFFKHQGFMNRLFPSRYDSLRVRIVWSSGSQSVLRGSLGIRDQFPGDPWQHFCNGYLKFVYFFKFKE